MTGRAFYIGAKPHERKAVMPAFMCNFALLGS